MDTNKDVTLEQASKVLGMSKGTVTNWMKRGICPYYRKGRYRFMTQKHLDTFQMRLREMRENGTEE